MKHILTIFIQKYRFYLISFGLLLIWILLLDRNSFLSQSEMRTELSEYKEAKKYYEEQLIAIEKEQKELMSNDDALEKYGREVYLMKKEGETVYALVEKDEK